MRTGYGDFDVLGKFKPALRLHIIPKLRICSSTRCLK